MNDILKNLKRVWKRKKILREIYFDWYRKIDKYIVPGKTLELGSGTGNFKEFKPDIISSDIDPQPWLDMSFDAHHIPFKNKALTNIVMIDVFHHLENPIQFLREAYRSLRVGGRVIMIEPYPSFISLMIYKLFHPEPFNFKVDYFENNMKEKNKEAWDSNQAIPYLIFFKYIDKFRMIFGNKFKLIKREKFSFILYPLSGGFGKRQVIPTFLFPLLKNIEHIFTPLKSVIAFRCFVVIEKIQ